MIILIGGSSHVGKTLIAQKLVEKYHYSCTSLDHLKMGFIRTGRTELTVNDDYKMRFFLWPFAAEMVKTAIENNQNMILEGCYIPKQWKESFSSDYLTHIKAVFIVMSENYIRNNFDLLSEYSCVIEKRLEEKLNLERLIMCSKEFKEDCLENGTPFIEIDSSYDVEQLFEQVVQRIEN
ncbi:MAG: adenylate kinase [Treponema sp.]|nr:adenylate kinase [Treponema sp.]